MKLTNQGYIKLHRKFLTSHVSRLNTTAVYLFICLLLAADKQGRVVTTLMEISQCFGVRSKSTVLMALRQLENVNAISIVNKPCLVIQVVNWGHYQARGSGSKNEPGGIKNEPHAVQNLDRGGIKFEPPTLYINKNNKNIFYTDKKNFLDFENPKKDLEKLVLFYAKGVNHPALAKVSKNETLNRALAMEIPHFQTILDNCRDLQQAKACVAYYVKQAKGRYSMYYLASQINSVRQEVESEENKNG